MIEWSDSGRHRCLLLSLSVLILDQYVPREWFWNWSVSAKKPAGVTSGLSLGDWQCLRQGAPLATGAVRGGSSGLLRWIDYANCPVAVYACDIEEISNVVVQ